jgi:tetratricopeptide (TPR) repeat protein
VSQAAADALTAEGHALFEQKHYAEAASRFERAATIFPSHPMAWKGLGNAYLCLGKTTEAARAFDRAIGLRPDSATALWGGALAHADLGHRIVAQNYLSRALQLQPTWVEMARTVPKLAAFLQLSSHTANLLRYALGAYSARAYKHAGDANLVLEVLRTGDCPEKGTITYASLGLCDHAWPEVGRPRVELLLASITDGEVCGQIVANTAFHLMGNNFFPEPGSIVRDVVAVLGHGDLSRRLPHVYFTVPRPWPIRLPLEEGPPPITLVMLVPVSEAEYQFWRGHGMKAFELALDAAGADLADLRRSGVL